jgi:putative FmdB family regulatory protein
MPLYEYECRQCHRRTEKIQKYSDAELTVCPHCGGALERTITAAAIAFKGGGWYKDGYASAKPAATGDATVPAADSSDSGGDSASSSSADSVSAKLAAAAPATAPAAPSTPAKT